MGCFRIAPLFRVLFDVEIMAAHLDAHFLRSQINSIYQGSSDVCENILAQGQER
jgi:hypothetical protein